MRSNTDSMKAVNGWRLYIFMSTSGQSIKTLKNINKHKKYKNG